MPQTVYIKTELTGGATTALDSIDGNSVSNLDMAIVITDTGSNNRIYFYVLDEDSALTESSPKVISPDSNAGNKRWVLQSPVSAEEADKMGFEGDYVT